MHITDPTVALDLLNLGIALGKGNQMSVHAGCIFLQKASFLIDCKIDVKFNYLKFLLKRLD